jgi:hypothetical protein
MSKPPSPALHGYYLATHGDADARFRRVVDEVCGQRN